MPQNAKAKTETYTQRLPVQGVVDRSVPLDIYLVATPVPGANEILEDPVGGPYGAMPGDPAWFPEGVNPRVAVCHILSGYAAARCLRGRGYF